MNEQIKQKFCQELGEEQVLFEEPMKRHTTFRIGGPAEVFVMPRTIEEIQKTLEICRREKLSYFILGNGSNLLVSDQGYKGVIIQMDRNMEQITVEGTEIRARWEHSFLLLRLQPEEHPLRDLSCGRYSGNAWRSGCDECRCLWRRDEGCTQGCNGNDRGR